MLELKEMPQILTIKSKFVLEEEPGKPTAEQGVIYELTAADIEKQAEALLDFHANYDEYFRTKTRSSAEQALEYLKGQLMLKGKINMSQMAIQVTKIDEQALSHFVSNSPWDDEPLTGQIGRDAVKLIGENGALLLDESGFAKQGDKSVGVARQYCGALGKVDNCQMGVFVAYTKAGQTQLIDKRLYLPQEWVDDPERCRAAGVPEEEILFRTKAELGLSLILQAKANHIPFEFVGMDAHYGQQPWLLSQLEAQPEPLEYMAEIPANTRVYLEYPTIGVPEKKGNRGRKPSKVRVLVGEPVEVRSLLETAHLQWTPLKVRETQRGELWINFAALRVWRIEDELPLPQPVWLCIRQNLDDNDLKFALSNASPASTQVTLARKLCTRYWVERSLEDSKGLAGLAGYQVIGWRGWHHHMTMSMLAMLFLLSLKQTLTPKAPMLTLQDAREILEIVMPKKTLTLDDAVDLIKKKHVNRFRSRQSYLKKQKQFLKKQLFHAHSFY